MKSITEKPVSENSFEKNNNTLYEIGSRWKLAWEASIEAGSLSFNKVFQWWFSAMEPQRKIKEKRWEETPSIRE